MTQRIEIPGLRIVSESNTREHWAKKNRRANGSKSKKNPTLGQRPTVRLVLQTKATRPKLPCVIRLTRIAPRKLDPGGNLATALKHVQDGCADWIGIDDRHDNLVKYEYFQEQVSKTYGLRIEIVEVKP